MKLLSGLCRSILSTMDFQHVLVQSSRDPPILKDPASEGLQANPVDGHTSAELHNELPAVGSEHEIHATDAYLTSGTVEGEGPDLLHSIDSLGRDTPPHEEELSTADR